MKLTGKAKEAANFILTMIERIAPNTPNTKLYTDFFNSMSNTDFEAYMKRIEDGVDKISLIIPNDKKIIDLERNIQIGNELGYGFYQYLWMEENGRKTRTNEKFLIIDLPIRRVSQLLSEKMKVPKNYNNIDILTGQSASNSDNKGAKITYPEVQLCAAMGLENSMIELMKYRGGDLDGYNFFINFLSNYGRAKQQILNSYTTSAKSTLTLKNYLTSIHIKSESLA